MSWQISEARSKVTIDLTSAGSSSSSGIQVTFVGSGNRICEQDQFPVIGWKVLRLKVVFTMTSTLISELLFLLL